ncbi:MAG TPA: hypothetical protein VNJ09_11025 [Chthonomonadales bacterium]|nr:hypothetical protein [Chthonomonadales bacterium]
MVTRSRKCFLQERTRARILLRAETNGPQDGLPDVRICEAGCYPVIALFIEL